MKKFIFITLTICMLALCLSLFACDNGNEGTTDNSTAKTSTTEEITTTEDASMLTTTPEETTTTIPEEITTDNVPVIDLSTPKKFFTLSFDDGITQDQKIIDILKKYDLTCCTFNLNTGLVGANWTWVAEATGCPGLSHLRYTARELSKGIYNGFELAVHTYTHPSLKDLSRADVKTQVTKDIEGIEKFCKQTPIGMAYPGGDTEWTDETVSWIVSDTDMRFGRMTASSYGFGLPEYFMKWMPTCHINDPRLSELTDEFINAEPTEHMLFYVWGHGYDIDLANGWDAFDKFIEKMSKCEDVVFVTNGQFYTLFKDEIPVWTDN